MRIAILVACLGVCLNCACSFIFVKGPPAAAEKLPPSEPIECTTGNAAPIIDTLIAGYQVFRTGYALSKTKADYAGAPITRDADIGFGVGLAALFAASSIYGYTKTSQCAEAQAAHELRAARPEGEGATPGVFTFSPNRRPAENSAPAPRQAAPAPAPRQAPAPAPPTSQAPPASPWAPDAPPAAADQGPPSSRVPETEASPEP